MGLTRVMLVTVSILASGVPVRAQTNCPGGVCPGFEWRILAGDDDCVYLYRDGVQIGAWRYSKGIWRDYDAVAGRWGPFRGAAPATPPVRAGVGVVQNHGIDLDKLEAYRQR